MRKLMSATIPNASGPHCWMTISVSDQRNCARPRSMFNKANTLSPMKLSIAAPPLHASRLDSPTRCRKVFLASSRTASVFSGTASASAMSFASPSGKVLARNSTFPLAHRSPMARMRTIKALSQWPS